MGSRDRAWEWRNGGTSILGRMPSERASGRAILNPKGGACASELQHSPSTSREVRERELLGVSGLGERLREHVGAVVFGGAVDGLDIAGVDAFADEVMADVDVLRSSVKLVILGESDGGEIISGDNGRRFCAEMEFSEEGAEPDGLFGSVSESDVLSFHSRKSDSALFLRTPTNDSVGKQECVSRDGSAVGTVLAPVGVAEPMSNEFRSIAVSDRQVASPLEIAKNVFSGRPMGQGVSGVELAEGLDRESNVGTSADCGVHE